MEVLDDFLTLKEFCKQYPHIVTLGRLRWLRFRSSETGSDFFVRKIGKRLVISPRLFFEWLEKQK